MKCFVRSEPELPVASTIGKFRIEASEKYSGDQELYTNLVAELGSDKPLENVSHHGRAEVVGATHKGRIIF